jgi:UDP-N-acetylglucosamine 3-dehydrogenase
MGYSAITLGVKEEGRLEDMASVVIEFSTGVIGTLEVDRISAQKQRFLRIAGELGSFTADYILQRGYFIGSSAEPILVMKHEEPLYLELCDFVSAVREERLPMTTGEEGLAALQMALDIHAQVERRGVRSCYHRGGRSFNV